MKIEAQLNAVHRSKIDLEHEQVRTENKALKMELSDRIYVLNEVMKSLQFLNQMRDFLSKE